jgi:acetyl esterase/lipase
VVLAIHGGGWRRFSKEEYGPKAAVLTRFGYAVVAPDYTLSSSGSASWPRNIEDLRGAVRWVRLSAAKYHFQSSEIAAMGESAGGHLALLLGMSSDPVSHPRASAAVEAVASFAGPTDLATLGHGSPFAGWAARQMMGSTPAQQPVAYKSASPIDLVTAGDPPVMLVHGLHDDVVPPSQSVQLAAVLKSLNVPSQLVLIPGAGHLLPLNVGSEPLARLLGFLRSALKRAPSTSA